MARERQDDPSEEMLSWRFRAGMYGFLAVVGVLFAFDDAGLRTTLVAAFPVGMTVYCLLRYLRSRRQLRGGT